MNMPTRPLALALLSLMASPVIAHSPSQPTRLSIYRETNDSLYDANNDGPQQSGYAVINEQHALSLQAGPQQTVVDALPPLLDATSLSLQPQHADFSIQAYRLYPTATAPETALQGQQVVVSGDNGQVLASGRLIPSPSGLAIQDAQGHVSWIQHYAAIQSAQAPPLGAKLELNLSSPRQQMAALNMSYASRGIGWRAVYQAQLASGSRCQLQWQSLASIANRSGRDWHAVRVDLIAGDVQLDGEMSARPMLLRAMAVAKLSDDLPQQTALDIYRRYRLANTVDLPDQSVSLLPLDAERHLDCQRDTVLDLGSGPSAGKQPELRLWPLDAQPHTSSRIQWVAPANLPAGTAFIKQADPDGSQQLLGRRSIQDTAQGQPVEIDLGRSFMLNARQSRLSTHLDRDHNQFDEQIRVTIDNADERASEIKIITHPRRWSQWRIVASDVPAQRDDAQQAHFMLHVPAHGHAQLTFTVRYQWQPGELAADK